MAFGNLIGIHRFTGESLSNVFEEFMGLANKCANNDLRICNIKAAEIHHTGPDGDKYRYEISFEALPYQKAANDNTNRNDLVLLTGIAILGHTVVGENLRYGIKYVIKDAQALLEKIKEEINGES